MLSFKRCLISSRLSDSAFSSSDNINKYSVLRIRINYVTVKKVSNVFVHIEYKIIYVIIFNCISSVVFVSNLVKIVINCIHRCTHSNIHIVILPIGKSTCEIKAVWRKSIFQIMNHLTGISILNRICIFIIFMI